jgi:hypothetical protein
MPRKRSFILRIGDAQVDAVFTSEGERYRNSRPVAEKDAEARGNRSDAVVRLPNCESLPVLLVGENYRLFFATRR